MIPSGNRNTGLVSDLLPYTCPKASLRQQGVFTTLLLGSACSQRCPTGSLMMSECDRLVGRAPAAMVKQRMSTADVAGEVACLRQRVLGMRLANIYDVNTKV